MQEKNTKIHTILLKVSTIILLVILTLILPTNKTKATNPNLIGIQVGGRITGFNPGYPWATSPYTYGYCQPHVYITVITPHIYAGEIAIRLPPFIPRASYNYTTPGLAYIGAYYPVPTNWLPVIGCPYDPVPVYFGTEFGTSKLPGK